MTLILIVLIPTLICVKERASVIGAGGRRVTKEGLRSRELIDNVKSI